MNYWIRQFFTRPGAHLRALWEVLVTTTLALLPLFVTAVVFNYKNTDSFDLQEGMKNAVGGGQLFLYAYGLIGTIFWLSFFKSDTPMHAPRRAIGFVTIAVSFFIVAMLGLDPTISNAKNPAIIRASYWTYGVFIFFTYLLLFYVNIEPPAAKDSLRVGTDNLKKAYSSLEGDHGH